MEAYYYTQFKKAEQAVYQAILKGITNLEDEFLIPACEAKILADIFFRLRLDHPEIFWATSYRCMHYQTSNNFIFKPEYLFKKDKIKVHQQAMTARVKKVVQPMLDKKMTDLDKELYVHDFICQNVHYDKLKKPYSHEIIGPLGHGVGVCEGIAKSVKILLDAAGVWNIIALCGNNPEKGIKYRHVWNIVRINGKYYHLDVTFDNSLSSDDFGIRYDYVNLPDKQIFRDHEPLLGTAPSCTESDHFYYKEKKLSFTKLTDVYNRSLQAAKKKKPLTFHWRGGYFTKEIIMEILEEIRKAANERNLTAMISINYAQAIVRVHFETPDKEEELIMQDANEGEKYEGE